MQIFFKVWLNELKTRELLKCYNIVLYMSVDIYVCTEAILLLKSSYIHKHFLQTFFGKLHFSSRYETRHATKNDKHYPTILQRHYRLLRNELNCLATVLCSQFFGEHKTHFLKRLFTSFLHNCE